jgi:4'-phosphopantetheinyl transferase
MAPTPSSSKRSAERGAVRLALRRRDEACAPDALSWLTTGERARHDSFGGSARRADFTAGRWLLREVLAEIHGGAPEHQTAEIDAEGRTSVPRGHANLSHTGDWLIAAWAESPIGVDIESLRARRDVLAIAERVASPAECAHLASLTGATQLEAFYRLWTLREAWLKRRGRGLDLQQMQGLRFEPDEQGDLACALLPRAHLMVALDVENLAGAALPSELASEPLHWQRHGAEPAT